MKQMLLQVLTIFVIMTSAHAEPKIVFDESNMASQSLSLAMHNWKKLELKRQGGEFKSHGWWPWGISGADFDNDGDIDIYVSHHGIPGGKVLLNQLAQGELRFVSRENDAPLPGADDKPWHYDIDGDGWIDILGLSDEQKAQSMFNREGREFVTAGFSLRPLSRPLDITDINNDGYLDIISNKHHYLYTPETRNYQRFDADDTLLSMLPEKFLNLAAEKKKLKRNRFFRFQVSDYFVNSHDQQGLSIDPIDLNSDGFVDTIYAGSGSYGGEYLGYYLLQSPSTKQYTESNRQLNLPKAGTPIHLQDLNGDGKQDLLITGTSTGGVYLQSSNGFRFVDGALSDFLKKPGAYLLRVYAQDFDHDGDLDIVVTNPRSGIFQVMQNKGEGLFDKVVSLRTWDSNAVFIADIDNDNDLDIITGGDGGHQSTSLRVLINKSSQLKDTIVIYPRGDKNNPYSVGAVVSLYNQNSEQVLRREKARWDGLPLILTVEKESELRVEVEYSNGSKRTFSGLKAGQRISLLSDGTIKKGFAAAHTNH